MSVSTRADNIPQKAWRTNLNSETLEMKERPHDLRFENVNMILSGQRITTSCAFKYAKLHANSLPVTDGMIVCLVPTDEVTTEFTAHGTPNLIFGVAIGTVRPGYYAWFQVMGFHPAVKTNGDDDISIGDIIIAADHGVCNSISSGTNINYKPIGVAIDSDNDIANTVPVNIQLLN
jgi:hypothetical protein